MKFIWRGAERLSNVMKTGKLKTLKNTKNIQHTVFHKVKRVPPAGERKTSNYDSSSYCLGITSYHTVFSSLSLLLLTVCLSCCLDAKLPESQIVILQPKFQNSWDAV